jgi:hypothetical protein
MVRAAQKVLTGFISTMTMKNIVSTAENHRMETGAFRHRPGSIFTAMGPTNVSTAAQLISAWDARTVRPENTKNEQIRLRGNP